MYILSLKKSNIFLYNDLKVKTFSNKEDITRLQLAGLLSPRIAMAGQATPISIWAPSEFANQSQGI